MPTLSSFELAMMTAVQTETLPATCTIGSLTRTSDGAGGWDDTYTESASTPCDYAPSDNGTDGQQSDTVRTVVEWAFAFPLGTVVATTNRITLTGSGRTFEVIAPLVYPWETFTRVLARETT